MTDSRLSQIETQWSIVRQACGEQTEKREALSMLMHRYGPAVKRYLLASLRDQDAAEEVFQEFSLKLVKGDFSSAAEDKGKFRSFLKTVVYRLIIDFHRRKKRSNKQAASEDLDALAVQPALNEDQSFSLAWREHLIERSWTQLQELEDESGKPWFSTLKTRVDNPALSTSKLHTMLVEQNLEVPELSAFRVFLHRCRKRFAAILISQVTETLDAPTANDIELELIELGLHHFCKTG